MPRLLTLVGFVVSLCGGALYLSPAAGQSGGPIYQRSDGACSPPIVNNSGQVTITCPGINPVALRSLEDGLSKLVQEIRQQHREFGESHRTIANQNDLIDRLRREANDWAKRYHDLSERLSAPDDDAANGKAGALIRQGRLAEAEALLERLAEQQEAQVARAAATHNSLGDVAMLRFETARAMAQYGKAYRFQPNNPLYAFNYAGAAEHQQRYAEAEEAYRTALRLSGDLATRDPGAYRPDVAGTLNNLGLL